MKISSVHTLVNVPRGSVPPAFVNAVATVLVFVAFGPNVSSADTCEARTVGAMALRTLLWAGTEGTAHRAIQRLA